MNRTNTYYESDEKGVSSSSAVHTVKSQTLFNGARVLRIVHGEQAYQLRITKENKLILTK